MRKMIVAFVLLVGLAACKKDHSEETVVTVRDMTGLDGCGMMLELENGQRLEPVSLPANTVLVDGARVAIRYKDQPAVSICMAGQTVKVTSLRYL